MLQARAMTITATERQPVGQETLAANGRTRILNAAAALFNRRGYAGTTMRDIAREADMQAGSLYYHFNSKEELLDAVETEAFRRVTDNVKQALEGLDEPWDRLEAACAAHLTAVLANREYINVTSQELTYVSTSGERVGRRLRRDYEEIFRELVQDLKLEEGVDASILRLTLLGGMAWSLVWYREGGNYTPAQVARKMIDILRCPTQKGANRE